MRSIYCIRGRRRRRTRVFRWRLRFWRASVARKRGGRWAWTARRFATGRIATTRRVPRVFGIGRAAAVYASSTMRSCRLCGVVRWRIRDIRRKIEEAFGVAYADESVRRLLRREGFRRLSGRSERPRGDAAAHSAFRSEFAVRVRARVREVLGSSALSQPVAVWFQDESRVGQKGMMSRLWARRGSRPSVVRNHRYGYRDLFGAACGSLGKASGPVSERANTAAINLHPVAIGAAVAPGGIGVVASDGAGRRRGRKLVLPDSIVLPTLLPTVPSSIRWRRCLSIRGTTVWRTGCSRMLRRWPRPAARLGSGSPALRTASPRSCAASGRLPPSPPLTAKMDDREPGLVSYVVNQYIMAGSPLSVVKRAVVKERLPVFGREKRSAFHALAHEKEIRRVSCGRIGRHGVSREIEIHRETRPERLGP